MRFDIDNLPSEPALLQHLIRDMAAAVEHRDGEIERLRAIIKQLQRAQFGRRSERLDPDQLALGLEDLEADVGRAEASQATVASKPAAARPKRKPLPDHLPREDVVLDVAGWSLPVLWRRTARHRRERQRDAGLDAGASCAWCASAVPNTAAAPAGRWPGAGAGAADRRGIGDARRCSPTCWSASIAITRRSIGSRRSSPGMASIWIARRWPTGSAALAGGSRRCTTGCASNVFASDNLFADDTPFRCLIRVAGKTKTGPAVGVCSR